MLISPAKVNLYFHVLSKRSDGYHEIASLYQAIDLVDYLSIEIAKNQDTLICHDPNVPLDGTNLILRAAKLFREKTGRKEHFAFFLDKKIPIQAGLGGGSSNAATALWGMNDLLGTQIKDEELARWGRELGADVSFFFSQGRAICEGFGDKVTLLNEEEQQTFWIAKPKEHLSTQKVFQALQLKSLTDKMTLRNDLEQPAFSLLPSLKKFKQDLLSLGFEHVLMTGSGTAFTCFGKVAQPHLENTQFYKVAFLTRSQGTWYKLS